MTVTAQDLLTMLGEEPWSGFNADDMVFSSDDAKPAKRILNRAVRYLINLQDFPFRSKEQLLETNNTTEVYRMVEGQIFKIYEAGTFEELEFVGDNSAFDKEKTGKPTHYWIEYNNPGQKIRMYPIPDDTYSYQVVYNMYKPIIDAAGKKQKFTFENEGDYLNLPDNIADMFADCLVLRAILTNNKDEQDENYRPTINEFNEHWRQFVRLAKPARIENRVVW